MEKKKEEEFKKEEYDKMIKRKDHRVIKVEYNVSKTYEGESAPVEEEPEEEKPKKKGKKGKKPSSKKAI